MTDDVEKRFDKPGAFRGPTIYVAAVVVVAAAAFAAYAFTSRDSVVLASTVPAVLFLGGIGAFVKTYVEWRRSGGWVAWQGAGWFLLILVLICLSIPGAAIQAG